MPSSTQKSVGLRVPCGSTTLKTSPPALISNAARRASEAQFPNTDAICATVAALARSVKGARPSVIAKHTSRRKDHRRSSRSPPPTTTVNQTFYVNFPSPPPTAPPSLEPAPPSTATPGHGSVTTKGSSRTSAAPRGSLARNDLRNFLARSRTSPGDPR